METLDFSDFDNRVSIGPVVTPGWRRSDDRVLVLIERADKLDTKRLMTPDSGRGRDAKSNITANSIQAVLGYAIACNRQIAGSHAFGVAVFSSATWQQTLASLKPTKVLLCGFRCSGLMLPDMPTFRFLLGNPVKRPDGVLYCQTLPLDQLLYKPDNSDKDASSADLLFMVARHASNLVYGSNPESLAGIKAVPVMVDTIEKFDRLMDKQWAAKEFAVDLETANLSSYANQLLTYQVAFGTNKGYILPIEHANSPFDAAQQKYIKQRLRKLWSTSDDDQRKTVVVFNGKFDLRVLRAKLKLPAIHHNIYEVTAGEHLLDENIGILNSTHFRGLEQGSVKVPVGNLRNMLCLYGNDSYYTMPFSKEARVTLVAVDIMTHVEAQRYMALDPCATFGLYQSQCAYAERIKVRHKDKLVPFYPHFINHVIHQMGVTAKTLSLMEEYGTYVDMEYCKDLQNPKVSELMPLIQSLKRRLLATESVAAAVKILNNNAGKTSNSLFKVSADVSAFQIKPAHLHILFFDVLKLKPTSFTATGSPSVDKAFLAEYADTCEEAEILAEYSEARKLLSTYVGSWQAAILESKDGRLDGCLRPSFDFFGVVTGRLSSWDPNLQNVPSRGKLAKLIKRMFVSPRGTLSPRWDFSAHEIRMWGNVSGDKAIAESFNAGFRLRQLLIQTATSDIRARLKKEGDAHIANIHRFFGKWVDKSDPLRDAIKQIVFGVVYGKSPRTLGSDLQKSRIVDLKKKLKSLQKELSECSKANN